MFETFASVMMLVVFLVPGYVWRTVESMAVYLDRGLEWQKFALGLLARSTLVYLPVAPFLYAAWRARFYEEHRWLTALAAIGFMLVLPTGYGLLAAFFRQHQAPRRWLQKCGLQPLVGPGAWYSLFVGIDPCWVIVTLRNGSRDQRMCPIWCFPYSRPPQRPKLVHRNPAL